MSGATKPTRLGKKLLDAIYAVDSKAACALVANGADVHYVSRDGGPNVAGAAAERCNELFASADIAGTIGHNGMLVMHPPRGSTAGVIRVDGRAGILARRFDAATLFRAPGLDRRRPTAGS